MYFPLKLTGPAKVDPEKCATLFCVPPVALNRELPKHSFRNELDDDALATFSEQGNQHSIGIRKEPLRMAHLSWTRH